MVLSLELVLDHSRSLARYTAIPVAFEVSESIRIGVGRALLAKVDERMQELGLAGIVAETQDINVGACELYARSGYVVSRVDSNAYVDFPEEVRVTWMKLFGAAAANHDER